MIRNRQFILVLGDIAALILSFFVMLFVRFSDSIQSAISLHGKAFFIIFILWLLILYIFDFYDIRRVNPNPRNIGRLALAFAVNASVAIILFYIFPFFGITPKITLAIVSVAAFGLLAVWRRLFYKIFTSLLSRSIILIGDSPAIHRFATEVNENPAIGKIVTIWKDGNGEIAEKENINLLISENTEPLLLLAAAEKLDCNALSLVRAYEELFGKIPLSLMNDERAMDIISRTENPGYKLIRRFFEVIISLLVLVISSPFLLIAMVAILIETGGPVFYSHKRVGKGGIPFTMYKLRSMIVNAEGKSGAVWAEMKDPRTTKVGKVIRKLHIDEIPQMWNILIGNLALVGPRPERPEFVTPLEKEIPYYYLRHIQKPGFTGWGQIKFRYARSMLDSKEKFEYDLYYLFNRSLILDLGIVIKTVQIIFTH
jgi:exopolysaccharide biosynthesis polyprenyl glycosylphosphotransferase